MRVCNLPERSTWSNLVQVNCFVCDVNLLRTDRSFLPEGYIYSSLSFCHIVVLVSSDQLLFGHLQSLHHNSVVFFRIE